MLTDPLEQWERLLKEISMQDIPIEFIKKLVLRLEGKKQHTINIQKLVNKGIESEEIEEIVVSQLYAMKSSIIAIKYVLDVENIANTVKPETEKLLNNL